MTSITEGLAEISERADTERENKITTAALLDYFIDRLDHVYDVLQRVEYLHADFENRFTHPADDFSNILDDIEAHGITRGARTYEPPHADPDSDGTTRTHYAEVPNTLHFGLNPIQRAIPYTLALSGSADSVREFTTQLIHHALTTAAETNLKDPKGAEINAIRTGDYDTGATLLEETLLPAIQSKVQYHLTKLETDGFMHKHSIGQSTGIELTRAGSVYTGTQDFVQECRESALEDICAVISEAYTDSE